MIFFFFPFSLGPPSAVWGGIKSYWTTCCVGGRKADRARGGFQALIELRHTKNLTAPIFCVTDPINPEKWSREEITSLDETSRGLSFNAVVIKNVILLSSVSLRSAPDKEMSITPWGEKHSEVNSINTYSKCDNVIFIFFLMAFFMSRWSQG